jgi:hypothetical protein
MNPFAGPPQVYLGAFVAMLIAILLFALAAVAVITFADTPRGRRMLRDYLGGRLASTRMWSMLEHRGVSPTRYVDEMPIQDLREQIRACRRCAKQDMCDETLNCVGWRKRDYGFCPNRKAITRVAFAPRAPQKSAPADG